MVLVAGRTVRRLKDGVTRDRKGFFLGVFEPRWEMKRIFQHHSRCMLKTVFFKVWLHQAPIGYFTTKSSVVSQQKPCHSQSFPRQAHAQNHPKLPVAAMCPRFTAHQRSTARQPSSSLRAFHTTYSSKEFSLAQILISTMYSTLYLRF